MLVRTGGEYVTRSGLKTPALRPFIDGQDEPAADIMGRNAWFFAEGFGAYDKHGEWLTGGTNCANDIVAEVGEPAQAEPKDVKFRELTVGIKVGSLTLLAEVKASAKWVIIDRAWLEPARIGAVLRLEADALDVLCIDRNGAPITFRTLIEDKAREEARA